MLQIKKACSMHQITSRHFFVYGFLYLLVFSANSQNFPFSSSKNPDLEHQLVVKDTAKVLETIRLSRNLHRQNHDLEKEHLLANRAVELALATEDTLLYARALDNLGLLYRFHQWYAQAIPLHTKAFKLVEEKPVPPIYKMIFANNAGVAARYNQQYSLSMDYYLKALKIAEEQNDLKNIGISSNGIGNTISNIPDKKNEALHYFQKSLDAHIQLKDSLGIAMNLLSIGNFYIESRDYSKAFKTLEELKTINRIRNDLFGKAITSESFGSAFLTQGNTVRAGQYFSEALEGYKKAGNSLKIADVLNKLGDLHQNLNPGLALDYYNRSLQVADSLKNKSLRMRNSYGISKIKEQQGDFSAALDFYKKGKALEDSIDIENQNIEITALHSQYNLERTESQIAMLQQEQFFRQEQLQAQNEKIKIQRLYILAVFFAAILVIILLYFQYKNKVAKRDAENKLAENEKQLLRATYEKHLAQAEIMISRMQINPHFIFNCLAAIKLLIQKGENKTAGQYLTTFSRFIRMVLELPKNETISLTEELNLIRYYLMLEEKRFEQKLNYTIQSGCSEEELSEIKIPPLLLQPFVENAIWHGLLPSAKPDKKLNISISNKNSGLEIIIEDNGVGRQKSASLSNEVSKNKSLGMKITRERIRQFNQSYDYQINLSVEDPETETGTRVILNIEKQTEKIKV